MTKSRSTLDTPLRDQLDKLVAFEAQDAPVVSLYLNLAPDRHGRDNFEVFCRKSLARRPDRRSLALHRRRAARVPPDASHRSIPTLRIGRPRYQPGPHLRVRSGDHRAAAEGEGRQDAALVDGRLVAGSLPAPGRELPPASRQGTVDTLDRVVRTDNIQHLIIVGDDVVVPLVKEALPQHLAEKVVDVFRLDGHAGEDEIVAATLDALRQKDAETDKERVEQLVARAQQTGARIRIIEDPELLHDHGGVGAILRFRI
jgi:hypothetical protein